MERRALQGAIRLSHHDDVNAARKGGRVEAAIQLLHLDEHLTGQLAHVVHGLTGLVGTKEVGKNNVIKQESGVFHSYAWLLKVHRINTSVKLLEESPGLGLQQRWAN